MNRTPILLLALIASGAFVACGSDDDDGPEAPGTANPHGIISGLVYDGSSAQPLADADVKIVSEGVVLAAKSDPSGLYSIPDVRTGNYYMTVSKDGYTDAFFQSSLTASAGNTLVANPTSTNVGIGLIKLSAQMKILLVDDFGTPVPNVAVRARTNYRYMQYSSSISPVGNYELNVTSDGAGIVTVAPLPDPLSVNGASLNPVLSIDIAPTLVPGTNGYGFLGLYNTTINMLQLGSAASGPTQGGVPVIVMSGPNTTFAVVNSNVQYIANGAGPSTGFGGAAGSTVAGDGPINIVFNQAVDPKSVRASYTNESGDPLTITPQVTVSTNTVAIRPSGPLGGGRRYNLVFHANSAYRADQNSGVGRELTFAAPFFVPGTGPVSIVSVTADPAAPTQRAIIELSEPVGPGFASSASLGCAAFYESPVNFDGTAAPFPGEWTSASTVQCPSLAVATFDTSRLTSLEPLSESGRFVHTGFSRYYALQYDNGANGGCKIGVTPPACVKPTTGTVTHLVFGYQPSSLTVTRATGEPVGDDLAFTLP